MIVEECEAMYESETHIGFRWKAGGFAWHLWLKPDALPELKIRGKATASGVRPAIYKRSPTPGARPTFCNAEAKTNAPMVAQVFALQRKHDLIAKAKAESEAKAAERAAQDREKDAAEIRKQLNYEQRALHGEGSVDAGHYLRSYVMDATDDQLRRMAARIR